MPYQKTYLNPRPNKWKGNWHSYSKYKRRLGKHSPMDYAIMAGTAAAGGYGAYMAWPTIKTAATGATSGGGKGFWSQLGGALTDGLIGGVRSGVSKRVDAQLAGDKGIYGTPAGALQISDQGFGREMSEAAFSQQQESQGQYLSWQSEQAALGRAFQAEENAKDRALTLAVYGNNGDTANGQRVAMSPMDEISVYAKKRSGQLWRRQHSNWKKAMREGRIFYGRNF